MPSSTGVTMSAGGTQFALTPQLANSDATIFGIPMMPYSAAVFASGSYNQFVVLRAKKR